MLTSATITKMAGLLKVSVDDINTAIKDEKEVDLTIPDDLTVLTTVELDTRDKNHQEEGKKIGKELGIKDVKKAAGIDIDGKDPVKIAQAIIDKAVTDAKLPQDEKVKQLTQENTLLRTQVTEKDSEVTTYKEKAESIQVDRKLLAAFPKNRASTLTDDEYLTLVKSQIQIEQVDGKEIIKRGGEVMRDKLANPLPLGEAVGSIFTERKGWLEAEAGATGGRGGGDRKAGAVYGKMSELRADWEGQGKSIQGQDFAKKVEEVVKSNPDFDTEN